MSGMCSTGGSNVCCDTAAATPIDGQCCKLCSSSDGSCLDREACPPCDASGDIENGVASPCTSSLAAGTSCEPTCNSGYTLTGLRSCDGHNLADTAVCDAMTCDPDFYVENDECKACASGTTSAGGSATTCTANCDANQYWDGESCEACLGTSTSSGGAATSCTCPVNTYAAKSESTWSCADCTAGRTKAANSAIPGTGDGEIEATACGAATSCSANQYIVAARARCARHSPTAITMDRRIASATAVITPKKQPAAFGAARRVRVRLPPGSRRMTARTLSACLHSRPPRRRPATRCWVTSPTRV